MMISCLIIVMTKDLRICYIKVKFIFQKRGEECQCDFCPDEKTLKRKYRKPECPCECADGREREMEMDGSCPVSIASSKGTFRWDCTSRFGNFVLYYNLFTNSFKFIKVYIIK